MKQVAVFVKITTTKYDSNNFNMCILKLATPYERNYFNQLE